jgi:hypothetical protein
VPEKVPLGMQKLKEKSKAKGNPQRSDFEKPANFEHRNEDEYRLQDGGKENGIEPPAVINHPIPMDRPSADGDPRRQD